MVDNNRLLLLGGRDFMRLYPVVSLQAAGGGGVRVIKGDSVNSLARVGSGSRILYGTITPLNNYNGLPLVHAQASKKAVRITLSGAGPGVPLFHLPYNNDQNFRVTLVDRQGVGNVNFFITEFVDGCSVYIEGTRAAPTAYHINAVSTRRPKSWKQFYWSDGRKRQADWRAKYAKMDQRFKTQGNKVWTVQLNAPGLQQPTKLENHDYMGDLGLDLNNLQGANKAPLNINGQTVDGFELMAQQGTVFGERNTGTGEWKFYIQRRAFVRYFHIPPMGGQPVQLAFQWIVDSVEQFWPNPKTGRLVP